MDDRIYNGMDEYISDLTTCKICFSTMDCPKTLSCLHTFCNYCISEIMKRTSVTCPYCKKTSAVKDVKDDFEIKELIRIRTEQNASDTPTYSARHQAQEQLKNLKFLRDRYQEYVNTANCSVKLELVQELRAYKRKWIKAFETECELAETAASVSIGLLNASRIAGHIVALVTIPV